MTILDQLADGLVAFCPCEPATSSPPAPTYQDSFTEHFVRDRDSGANVFSTWAPGRPYNSAAYPTHPFSPGLTNSGQVARLQGAGPTQFRGYLSAHSSLITSLVAPFTVCGWFYLDYSPASASTEPTILGIKSAAFSGNDYTFRVGAAHASAWKFFAVRVHVSGEPTYRIDHYLNGSWSYGTTVNAANNWSPTSIYSEARSNSGSGQYYYLDNLAIWSRGLTDEEVDWYANWLPPFSAEAGATIHTPTAPPKIASGNWYAPPGLPGLAAATVQTPHAPPLAARYDVRTPLGPPRVAGVQCLAGNLPPVAAYAIVDASLVFTAEEAGANVVTPPAPPLPAISQVVTTLAPPLTAQVTTHTPTGPPKLAGGNWRTSIVLTAGEAAANIVAMPAPPSATGVQVHASHTPPLDVFGQWKSTISVTADEAGANIDTPHAPPIQAGGQWRTTVSAPGAAGGQWITTHSSPGESGGNWITQRPRDNRVPSMTIDSPGLLTFIEFVYAGIV